MITPKDINILIACEESQAECLAFRKRGFNAFSCDIQKARFEPQYHIQADVTPLLAGTTEFTTQDGVHHTVGKWHLIIAHPPCTYLCKVSSVRMRIDGEIQPERYAKMLEARKFFYYCLVAFAPFVAVENPIPMRLARLPKPSCYVQPYWYGEKYSKKTLYWLRNLPPLLPTVTNPVFKCFVRSSRGKYRSRTFPGIANAIAEQWGRYILDELNRTENP